jgi:hypothetical protein
VRGHNLRGRGWIAALAIVLLIVAHVVLFGVATRLYYWLTLDKLL